MIVEAKKISHLWQEKEGKSHTLSAAQTDRLITPLLNNAALGLQFACQFSYFALVTNCSLSPSAPGATK